MIADLLAGSGELVLGLVFALGAVLAAAHAAILVVRASRERRRRRVAIEALEAVRRARSRARARRSARPRVNFTFRGGRLLRRGD